MKTITSLRGLLLFATLIMVSCNDRNDPTPVEPPKIESLSAENVVFSDNAPSQTITFTTNTNWEITVPSNNWLTVSPSSGSAGSVSATFTSALNDTYDDRSIQATITAGSLNKVISVVQKNKLALLLSQSINEVPQSGGIVDVELKTNIDYQITIPDQYKSWISQLTTKGLSTFNHKFKIEPSEEFDNREGKVVFKDKNSNISDTLRIFQTSKNGFVFSKRNINVTDLGETIDIVLKSNVDFNVILPTDAWIVPLQTKALTSYEYKFNIMPNETNVARETKVVFKDKNSALSDTVHIYQYRRGALVFDKSILEVDKKGGEISFNVRPDIEFEIKILNSPWITRNEPKDPTGSDIKFMISENTNVGVRSGQIVFKDSKTNLADTIKIIQFGMLSPVEIERNLLIDFYKSTKGAQWINNSNWCTTKQLNEWYGITTNASGRVTKIDLANNNVVGTLPASIFDLTQLEVLKIVGTDLTGSIPNNIGALSKLTELSFYDTKLSGAIPAEIGNLEQLQALRLQRCLLTGSIPKELGRLSNATVILFGSNNLTGEIPAELALLPKLSYLHMSGNSLSGSLPTQFGESKSITGLYLSNNTLTGSIPSSYSKLLDRAEFFALDLLRNNLSGNLPASITSHARWNDFAFDLVTQNYAYGFNLQGVEYYLPDIKFTDINDKELAIRDIYSKNKLTVILNWADWCPYTVVFIDGSLSKLYSGYKTKGLEIVANASGSGSPLQNIKDFVNSKQIPWITTYKADDNYSKLRFSGFPMLVIVDNKGRVIFDKDNRGELEDLLKRELGDPEYSSLYESKDYSKDGKYVQLMKATKGRGIDFVLMGDGFVDKNINSGTYEKYMRDAMNGMFSIEPMKSYKEYFNVYMVYVVSKNEIVGAKGSQTKLEVEFGAGTIMKGNDSICIAYSKKTPIVDVDKTIITVIANDNRWAGTCYMYYSGGAVAYQPISFGTDALHALVQHEAIGHGFGKLMDEYIIETGSIPTDEKEEYLRVVKKYGWYANVDFTSDPKAVKWKHFIGNAKYPYVNIYEGGGLYKKGVFRPEYVSCMEDNRPYFNAPSREAIVKVIKKWGGEVYVWNDFLAKDVALPLSTKAIQDLKLPKERLAPPVIVKGSLSDKL